MGRIFPDYSPLTLGVGPNLIYDALASVTGKRREDVISTLNRTGEIGKTAETLLASKVQTSFFLEEMSLSDIYSSCESIAGIQGRKSVREKLRTVQKLFANSTPREGRYLARIARAFSVDPALVEHANQAINDLGEVAVLAKLGEDHLRTVRIRPFHPVRMMLAQAGTITGVIAENGPVVAEFKYDGSRFQFHQAEGQARIYSRRLEEVTTALPDVIEILSSATAHEVILDGEVIALKDGRPMPFQTVLRRFRRKHDVGTVSQEVKLVPVVFDILYLDGEMLIDLPLTRRRQILEGVVSGVLAPSIVSDRPEEVEALYQQALAEGHEGLMVKVPGSGYTPGVRGKNWIKIKPAADTLDLVVIGGEWGEGKRARLFGSFLLACRDDRGDKIPITRVATGFSDEELAELHDILAGMVTVTEGKEVRFETDLVFEIGYAEIQKSPNYEGGFALRFPRFVRIRDDKSPDDIDTLETIARRYAIQEAGSKG
jgi:DNA ligase-1